MAHRGYLTRGDKLLILLAILVVAPLAIIGWPLLVVGLVALGVVLIVVLIAHTVVEWFVRRRRRPSGSAIELSRHQPKTMSIRHFRTPSGRDRERS